MYRKYTLSNNEGEILDIQYVSNKMNLFILLNPFYCLERSHLRWIPIMDVMIFTVLSFFNVEMDILPYAYSIGRMYGCVNNGKLLSDHLAKKGYRHEKDVETRF